MKLLRVKGLKASVSGREILHGVNLEIDRGETVVLLGKNGAGKSTVAKAVMGLLMDDGINNDEVRLIGKVMFNNEDVSLLTRDERARKGMFLSYQAPVEIPGVTMLEMLRTALEERRGRGVPRAELEEKVADAVRELKMDAFAPGREVNVGASGGEQKKNELLQMLVLEPELVMLDEIDSGLDASAAKVVAKVVADYQKRTGAGLLVITHNMRVLDGLKVDRTYLMDGGRVIETGGAELAERIEREGYRQ